MACVPKLRDPRVGDSRFHQAAGRKPVSRKNRFPDDENVQALGRILLQDAFDCGGPPQADGSCGRKKKDETSLGRICIEASRELIKIGFIQWRQRRATTICNVNGEDNRKHNDGKNNDISFFHQRHGRP